VVFNSKKREEFGLNKDYNLKTTPMKPIYN